MISDKALLEVAIQGCCACDHASTFAKNTANE